jgi:hypothetical protein
LQRSSSCTTTQRPSRAKPPTPRRFHHHNNRRRAYDAQWHRQQRYHVNRAPSSGYVNYLTGDKSQVHTSIPTYAATRVAQAYPGIDLVYYGTDRQLEYDFVVAPNADPGLVHLSFDGAKPVLEPTGELRLMIASSKHGSDIAENGDVAFKVGAYDPTRELIIDPVISYGSYFGGSGEDEINGSALNSNNQLYAAARPSLLSCPAVRASSRA